MTTLNTAPLFHAALSGTGKVLIDVSGYDDFGSSLALQADGKLLIGGYSANGSGYFDFSLIRLNTDGTLDASFSSDGKAIFDLAGGDDYGYSLSVQSDGKILLAGAGKYDFSVIRLNADGTLDTTFSGDGKASFDLFGAYNNDDGRSLTVQGDGKILIAGHSATSAGAWNFSVIRLNADGTLDASFSGDGKASFDIAANTDLSYGLTVQPDGKILVAGHSYTGSSVDFSLIRLNADGALDTSFSGDGKATFDIGTGTDYGQSMTLQSDGKIVVAGTSYNPSTGSSYFSLIRLNTDGTLDTTFSGDGKATVDVGGYYNDYGQSVAVQADGKILVAGYSYVSSGNTDFSVIRLNADGTLDTSFSGDGKATFDVGGDKDAGYSLSVQADGKILIAGASKSSAGTSDFSVIRLNADGTLDTSFGALPVSASLDASASYTENAAPVALDASVKVYDAELAALDGGLGNYSGASVTLSRHGGASSQDVFSGLGNLSLSGGSAMLSGTYVGAVSNVGGMLVITFATKATQACVDEVLSSIAYANTSDAPPASVQIDWLFSDGASAIALTAAGSTTVKIQATNDAPSGTVTITGTPVLGQTLTASNTLADVDGLGAISYQWLRAGVAIAGATGASYLFTPNDAGQPLSVRASYIDASGTAESVTSAACNTAPVFQGPPAGTGKTFIDVGGDDFGSSLTLQSDSKILLAGASYSSSGLSDFSVIRLNANGTLDTSFSGDGKASFDVGGSYDDSFTVKVQADGKILVAGYSKDSSGANDFSLIRLNADGTLDTSFSNDGKTLVDTGSSNDEGFSLGVQSDGKILLAGFSSYDFSVIRLNADGTLDTTFSGDGKASIPVGASDDYGWSLTVQGDGKILVAGYSYNSAWKTDFSLIRLNADGSLDTSFSGDGKVQIDVGGYAKDNQGHSVSLQADGKILVGGYSYNASGNWDFSVVRLNADGALDTAFSGDGKALIDIGGKDDYGYSLAVQGDGKILLAGTSASTDGSGYNFSVIRLSADGTLDTSFSGDGKALFDVGSSDDHGRTLSVQSDGKILIAGASTGSSGSYDFSLIRLNADGTLDTTFGDLPAGAGGSTGSTLDGVAAYTEGAAAIALDASVAVYDAELAALNGGAGNYSGASVTLSRHGGASGQDVFSGKGSLVLAGGNAVLSGVSVGTFANTGGTLSITFNANATQARVNEALSSIGYANTSDAPPASVQIDWVFSEGNSATALKVVDKTTIHVIPVNDAPTGAVTITGSATQGKTLTASHTLADPDGLGIVVTYQWKADGVAIAGATASALLLGQDQVGKAITVTASYTDGFGTLERVSSSASAAVFNANDAPSGSVTLTGTADEGQTLTASNSLGDADGLGTVSYEWRANGQVIEGATGDTLVLTGAHLGQSITVNALYTDGQGTQESVPSSNAMTVMAGSNTAPVFYAAIPGTGKAVIDIGGASDYGQSLSVQADGKILVAGYSDIASYTDFSLIRLNADGTLDTSFSGDGKATFGVGSSYDTGQSVAVQSDGKILVAGYSSNGAGYVDFSLIRLNANGTLDSTFSGDGKALIDIASSYDYGYSLTLQGDGKILLAGYSSQGMSTDFSLIRLNADGTLDSSFSGDGKAAFDVGAYKDTGRSVTVQSDGKIVVAGLSDGSSGPPCFSLIRVNADGTLDTSFSEDGKAVFDLASTDTGCSVAVQGDGKILLAGSSLGDFGLIRLNADGTLDTSFSGDGKAVFDVGGSYDNAQSVAVQSDGKILVAGTSNGSSGSADFSVIRLNADGTLDETFSGDGRVTVDIAGAGDYGYSLSVQGDGKIVVAGRSSVGNSADFSVVRLNADGTLDTSFNKPAFGSGVQFDATLDASVSCAENAAPVVLDASAAVHDAELAALNGGAGNYSGASVTWGRHGGASSQDVFSGTGHLVLTGGNAVLSGVTVGTVSNADGRLVITFNANATQARVNETLASIAYANTSDAPPASAQIDWLFSDGQSAAGRSVAGSTTVSVTGVNDALTGSLTIAGIAKQGQTLTAADTLADLDGMGAVSYQWKADGVVIAGATASTLVLGQAQVGQVITVTASYSDGGGTLESVTSSASAAVENINDAPTGSVTFSGATIQGQTLTAADTLADLDGMGSVSYQWSADGVAIAGATASTLVLGQAQVYKAITLTASYTDGDGEFESVTSSASAAVENVNDAPTGSVSITGATTQGQTLTAADTLGDLDGMGTLSYQWMADGVAITGATASALLLSQAQVGKAITVTASYSDGYGTLESKTSAATTAVSAMVTPPEPTEPPNNPPTGSVTITGTATQGQPLMATNTLADLDGMGPVSYQWEADGVAISGATASTLVLGQAQVGKAITVTASYSDKGGTLESVTSGASAAVENVNDASTGSVTFSGATTQGQTLRASHTLTDVDGMGAVSYQWMAGGVAIAGATSSTLVLGQPQVGKAITVTASYSDGYGKLESVTSGASPAVGNINDAPTGSVTFSGATTQGQTLTVAHTLADLDGMGTVSYQWMAGGVAIAGATASTLVLGQAQVGKAITVTASYTDGYGKLESVTSGASAAVGNINDAPTGSVTISGAAKQGQTLTAANTLADPDGMGAVSYQWKAGGIAIAGATASTLVLGQAHVGKAITVTASYTDGYGKLESKTSTASAAVVALDTTAPTVTTFTPVDEASGVLPSSNIVLTFSEAVAKGAGSVVLKTAAGVVIASYDAATSANLTLSSDKTTLTINPGSDLAWSTAYKVELSAGSFKDLAGNSYAGTASYNFSTAGTTYTGTAGADSLTGGVGKDTLNGLGGNDTLNGGAGADSMSAGDGSDSYYVDNAGDVVSETNATASTGGTDLVNSSLAAYTLGANVENGRILATGTASLAGNEVNNVLYAGAGNNVLDGGAGSDTVSYSYASAAVIISLASTLAQASGGSGSDTLKNVENLTGSSYADSLTGNTANNALNGGAGNDLLNGGAGNDVLSGGLGADKLTGGTGADRFDFNSLSELGLSGTTWDTLMDFKASEADKIDLLGVDANTALAGDQAFSFLGSLSAFTGDATAKLRFDTVNRILYGSTDADTAAEFAIALSGVSSLKAADFVL